MSEIKKTYALDGKKPLDAATGHVVSVSQITGRGMIDLRGILSDAKFKRAAKKALGVELPGEPRTSVAKGALSILWLSVDQWLICCAADQAGPLGQKLRKELDGIHSQVTDLSDARTIIRLAGDGVREVIMKAAPVDLTTAEFRPGTVRRLRFGDVAGMVHLLGGEPEAIDLFVFRSHAGYVWDWIEVTAHKASAIRVFGEQPAPAV